MFRLGLAIGGAIIAAAVTGLIGLLSGDGIWAGAALAAIIVGLALWWAGGDEDLEDGP
jgi:hypothetical protein